MEALDNVRKKLWHSLNKDVKSLENEHPRGRGRPSKEDEETSKKIAEAKDKAKQIKGSTFTVGKAPENLTQKQQVQLEFIAKTELDSFFWNATHSRISYFKELAYKIRRHEGNILNTIKTGLSNARVES